MCSSLNRLKGKVKSLDEDTQTFRLHHWNCRTRNSQHFQQNCINIIWKQKWNLVLLLVLQLEQKMSLNGSDGIWEYINSSTTRVLFFLRFCGKIFLRTFLKAEKIKNWVSFNELLLSYFMYFSTQVQVCTHTAWKAWVTFEP